MVRVRCEQCELDMEVPSGSVGKKLKCPGCGRIFVCQLPKAIVLDAPPVAAPSEEPVVLEEEVVVAPPDAAAELAEASSGTKQAADDALAELDRSAPKRRVRPNRRHWHLIVHGVAAVALTYDQLVRRAAAGEIKPKTKIYYSPKDVTIPARDIPGLFPAIDAERRQAARPRPVGRLSKDELAEASALAEALGTLNAQEAGEDEPARPPDEQPEDPSPDVDALADALDKLEEEKGEG
jgi:hypothetical protein